MFYNYREKQFAFFFGILFLFSCGKDLKDAGLSTAIQSNLRFDNNGNGVRLTHTESEFGVLNYAYNEDGLVDRIDASYYGGYFKHEYNSSGRLIVARFYSLDDVLQFRIEFFYENNDAVHEIWYNANTTDKIDEVFYTINSKGQTTKMESFLLGYYATYEYSPESNLTSFSFYFGGILGVYAEYTYLNHLKNPTSAIPGRTYDYYSVAGHYDRNKWYSTSQYFVFYDAQGNGTVVSDQDPLKNVTTAGPSNYAATSDFYENLSGETIHFKFSYEKGNNAGVVKASNKMSLPKLLERRTISSLNEKIKEFKLQQQAR